LQMRWLNWYAEYICYLLQNHQNTFLIW